MFRKSLQNNKIQSNQVFCDKLNVFQYWTFCFIAEEKLDLNGRKLENNWPCLNRAEPDTKFNVSHINLKARVRSFEPSNLKQTDGQTDTDT
jgi:hypothetical protein